MSVQLFRQGILAQVWLFAHCPQRLSRIQMLAFPISESVLVLKSCKTVVALRIAAQILIGVVKLYAGQVDWALEELGEALEQIGRTVEHVLVRQTAEIPLKTRKNAIVAIKKTEFSTYLQPAQETPMEIVACTEEITISEANYKANPLPNPIKSDHIGTSSTFLEDLMDEEFRIDPILPKLPAALPNIEPEAVPETVPVLQEVEEEQVNVMDLDWSVREEPTPVKKKRAKREKAGKAINMQEEDEVILPAEPTEEEENEILAFSQSQIPSPNLPPISTPILEPPKRGFRKLKKGWSPDIGSLLIDYESIANLDSTGDIVRIPTFEQKSTSKSQSALEKWLLYESLVEGMTKELADWYTSSHKILLVKNALREVEEPEIPSIAPIPTKRERTPVLPVPPVVSADPEPIIPILKFEPIDDTPSPEQLSERSVKMLQLLGNRLKGRTKLLFSDLAAGKGAHTRACGFFELLVLTKRRLIAIEQTEGWGEIEIRLEHKV